MGQPLVDPALSSRRPTMGTCRPDLRRLVTLGGQIFVVSGSMGKLVNQYVIGGLEVHDKLPSQMAAFEKYPEHRIHYNAAGQRLGNIIVTEDGDHDPRDGHDKFDRRIQNYLVGKNPVFLETEREITLGREHTVEILARIFDKPAAKRIREVMGRMAKLSDEQAGRLREALMQLKAEASR